MANSNVSSAAAPRSRSANDRWKSRWEGWLLRSMIAAAGVHAVVLILWPVWEIARPEREPSQLEFVQFEPIAGFGGTSDPGEGVIAALPTEDEVELAREEAGESAEEDVLSEVAGVNLPAAAYAFVPEVVPDGASIVEEPGTNRTLLLDKLSRISPDVTSLTPEIGWPQIRNPSVITRYLATRFNELYQTFGASGNVRVAMWIDERGDVEWARVSESSGDDRLDGIALTLFEDVVAFAPARSRGKGIPVQVTISVPFTLPW